MVASKGGATYGGKYPIVPSRALYRKIKRLMNAINYSELTTSTNAPPAQTATALLAIILGMMREMLNPDSFSMALVRAEKIGAEAGVAPEEMERVASIATRHYAMQRRANPMSDLF